MDRPLRLISANPLDALARTINPSHTTGDGDTVFALATSRWTGEANVSTIGALAADVLSEAIVRAVSTAEPLGGLPSARALGTAPRAGVAPVDALLSELAELAERQRVVLAALAAAGAPRERVHRLAAVA